MIGYRIVKLDKAGEVKEYQGTVYVSWFTEHESGAKIYYDKFYAKKSLRAHLKGNYFSSKE